MGTQFWCLMERPNRGRIRSTKIHALDLFDAPLKIRVFDGPR